MKRGFVLTLLGATMVLARPSDPELKGCIDNLKSLATACELYQTDWGYYPPRLQCLTLKGISGGYLRQIPTCPAAGQDTYSHGYRSRRHNLDKNQQWNGGTNTYFIQCSGHHHPPLPPRRPEFHYLRGLRLR